MPPESPRSPREIAADIRSSHEQVETIIDRLTNEELIARPEHGGRWLLKGHLAHLAEWRKHALAVLAGTPAHEARGIDEESHARLDTDDLNEILFERNRDRPLDDVLRDFRHTCDHLEDIRSLARR